MILNKVLEVCKQHLLLRFFILWCNHQGQKFTETWPKFSASWISMQNNWKYIFGQIFTFDPIGRDSFGFSPQNQLRSVSVSHFWKTISPISTICGVLTCALWPTVDSIRRRESVAHFDIWQVLLFSERLLYFSMYYHGVAYQLNCKLLLRFAIVVLLGCCEFKPNVTCVRIHVWSPIAMPHTAGAWWKASGSAKWGCYRLVCVTEKNDGGILTR